MAIHLSTFLTHAALVGSAYLPPKKYSLPDRQTITIAGKPDWKVEEEWNERNSLKNTPSPGIPPAPAKNNYELIPGVTTEPVYLPDHPISIERARKAQERYRYFERKQDEKLPGRRSQTILNPVTGLTFEYHCDQGDQKTGDPDPTCPQTIPQIPLSTGSIGVAPGLTVASNTLIKPESHCSQQDVCEPGNGANPLRQDRKRPNNLSIPFFL